jgi:hypothetical protein
MTTRSPLPSVSAVALVTGVAPGRAAGAALAWAALAGAALTGAALAGARKAAKPVIPARSAGATKRKVRAGVTGSLLNDITT